MTTEEKIFKDIVDYYVRKAVKSAVYRIQRTTKDAMILNKPYLKNLWDEICVQKQSQESIFWSLIDEMVEMTCDLIFEEMSSPIQMAISYKAYSENKPDGEYGIIYHDEGVRLIKEKVYSHAIDYSNKEIEQFKETDYID